MNHETPAPPDDRLLELIKEPPVLSAFPDPDRQVGQREELYEIDSWTIPEFASSPLHFLAQQWREGDVLPGVMRNPSTRGVHEIAHTRLRRQLERYGLLHQMAHGKSEPDLQQAADIAQEAILWLWSHQLSEEGSHELPKDHPHTHELLMPIALHAFEVGQEQYAHKQELFAIIEKPEFQVAWLALAERLEKARQPATLEDIVTKFVQRLHITYRTQVEEAALKSGMEPCAARKYAQMVIETLLDDVSTIGFGVMGKDEY